LALVEPEAMLAVAVDAVVGYFMIFIHPSWTVKRVLYVITSLLGWTSSVALTDECEECHSPTNTRFVGCLKSCLLLHGRREINHHGAVLGCYVDQALPLQSFVMQWLVPSQRTQS